MGNICRGNGLYDEKTGCFETMSRSPFKFWKDDNNKRSSSHNDTDNNTNNKNNMKDDEEEKKQVQKKPPEDVQMAEAVVTKEPQPVRPPPPTDFSVNRRNLNSNQTSISVPKPPEVVQMTEAVVTKEPQPIRPPPPTDFSVNRRNLSSNQTSISVLQRRTEALENVYSLGRRLGQGKFGTSHLVVEKSSGKEFACKSIAKRKLTCAEAVEDVRREIEIMYHLAGHPNVVTIVGAYEDMTSVHLVMELCSGGELFDRIIQRGHYSERKAARLIKVIVGVVETCHSLGVMHRDLKLENFLFSNSNEDSPLKAIDFGLSAFFKPGERVLSWLSFFFRCFGSVSVP